MLNSYGDHSARHHPESEGHHPFRSEQQDRLGVEIGTLLSAAVAVGLFATSISLTALNGQAPLLRYLGIAASAALALFAFFHLVANAAFGKKSMTPKPSGRADILRLLAITYFSWTFGLSLFVHPDRLDAILSLIALLVVVSAQESSLQATLRNLRILLFVAVAIFLIPAVTGDGYVAEGRTWFDILPGRYFSFSNPNALAFIGGLSAVLALPVLKKRGGALLIMPGVALGIMAAGNTTAIAAAAALAAYIFLAAARWIRPIQLGVSLLASATIALLMFISTDVGVSIVRYIEQRAELSGRSRIWVSLVRASTTDGNFWVGVGDSGVSARTTELSGVASAHSTLIQSYLSGGFITSALLVTLVAVCTIRLTRTQDHRIPPAERTALALIVYWFAISLTSNQPGSPLGLSLVLLMALTAPPSENSLVGRDSKRHSPNNSRRE